MAYLIFKAVGGGNNLLAASIANDPKGAVLAWKTTAPIAMLTVAQKILRPHWIGGNLYALSAEDVLYLLKPKLGLTEGSKRWLSAIDVAIGVAVGVLVIATFALNVFWFMMLVTIAVVFGHGLRR